MLKKDLFEETFDNMLYTVVTEAENKIVDEILQNVNLEENIEFSKHHEKQMKNIFRRERRKIFSKKILRPLKYVAIFFLTSIVVSSISIFSVEAWRIKFVNFFDRKEKYTEIGYSLPEKNNIFENDRIRLDYIANGYVFEESIQSRNEYSLKFINGEKYFRFIMNSSVSVIQADTENAEAKELLLNETKAFFTKKDDIGILIWHDDNYVLKLSGNLSEEEIILIAENLKIKK